jgi:hypothetical protein
MDPYKVKLTPQDTEHFIKYRFNNCTYMRLYNDNCDDIQINLKLSMSILSKHIKKLSLSAKQKHIGST